MGIQKITTLQLLAEKRVVGIVRTNARQEAYEKSKAIQEGGISFLEVTLTTPGALSVIEKLRIEQDAEQMIGAGTVMDAESARAAILSGAQFIISPNLDEGLIRMCNRYGIPCIPGIGTVTEAVKALELGIDVVKAFPGSLLGPDFVKAIHGPVPQIEVVPTGGVSKDNIRDWFAAGAFGVALGSALCYPKSGDDLKNITKETRNIVSAVEEAKLSAGGN